MGRFQDGNGRLTAAVTASPSVDACCAMREELPGERSLRCGLGGGSSPPPGGRVYFGTKGACELSTCVSQMATVVVRPSGVSVSTIAEIDARDGMR
jgi:hypothetical protein